MYKIAEKNAACFFFFVIFSLLAAAAQLFFFLFRVNDRCEKIAEEKVFSYYVLWNMSVQIFFRVFSAVPN